MTVSTDIQLVSPQRRIWPFGFSLAEGIDLVGGEARNMPITHAISNGFGFGGVNASIVLRRWS
jgi:3-oxoacyl-(acyl-carrier-protein) synthase